MNSENLNSEIAELVATHAINHIIALESAVKVGMRLLDIKKQIASEEWVVWATENCPLSRQTRNNYMSLARYWLATGEYPSSSSLTVSISLLSASEEVKMIVKEKEAVGEVVTQQEVAKLKQKLPTAKRIASKVVGLRKFISAGKQSEAIEYSDWLNIRDDIADALEDINIIIASAKK